MVTKKFKIILKKVTDDKIQNINKKSKIVTINGNKNI